MRRGVLPCAIALLSAAAAFAIQGHAAKTAGAGAYGAGSLEGDVTVSLLGGFRGIAAEVIWFRAERLQDTGRFVELAQLASLLTRLEPHTPEVWSYAAWNLAYNVSVQMPSFEDRWRWVDAGLRLLRDDGLRLNPSDASLHRELAWMFLAKIGGTIDDAAALYSEKWRGIMRDAAEKGDYSAVKRDPAAMREADAEYGRLDWTCPEAAAIYWARRGLAAADGGSRQALRRIVYQALMVMAQRDGTFAPRAWAELKSYVGEYPSERGERLVEAFGEHYNLK